MRKIYRNFITAEEAIKIDKDLKTNGKYFLKKRLSVLDEIGWNYITKIIDTIKEDFDFEIKEQSYFKKEKKNANTPHNWHKDTGSSNHMQWCQVGMSLILKESEFGGETYYAKDNDLFNKEYDDNYFYKEGKNDNMKVTNKVKSDRGIYDLAVHTSDEWHYVTGGDGNRMTLLMFI